MKYKGSYYQMWDAWFLNDNDTIHAFHLKNHEGENWNLGHVYTDDLLHFKECSSILNPLPEEKYPDDCLGKYTGCAYKDEKSGKYLVYYTMRAKNTSEKIGVAMSEDLINFGVYPSNPVLTPDPNIFIVSPQEEKTNCRDMLVVKDEKSSKYYGYFAAMADVGRGCPIGVIGVAESGDLLNWSNQSICYIPNFNGVIEVPDVYYMEGKWYLTILTGTIYGAKGSIGDDRIENVTLYASADNPRGMFEETEDNIFIGGANDSGYTCRTFMYKGKRYVMYIDARNKGAAISLPKEVRVIDGKLRPCYTDILQNMRVKKLIDNPVPEMFEKRYSTFAWESYSGEVTADNGGISLCTNDYSYMTYMLKDASAKSIEVECDFVCDGTEGGLTIECEGANFPEAILLADKEMYSISVNPEEGLLSVYSGGIYYKYYCGRKYDFKKGNEYHLRVIAQEGILEIYINNVIVVQGAIKDAQSFSAGIFSGKGKSNFKNLKVYELEK